MGIPEIEDAGCLLCFGYNGADSHPIVARRIVRGKQKGMKIICADPRVTETARISDIHLQLKGGSNLALVNAMANVIWNEGLADKKFIDEHTKGFDEFLKVIENTLRNMQSLLRTFRQKPFAGRQECTQPPNRP